MTLFLSQTSLVARTLCLSSPLTGTNIRPVLEATSKFSNVCFDADAGRKKMVDFQQIYWFSSDKTIYVLNLETVVKLENIDA